MRKPIDKSSSILPLVYSARKKQLKFPSKAKDQGSSKRNAKYLSQILLNKIHGSQEISDQIAASAVYGFKSYISSHEFVNFYPVDLHNYVKTGGESLFAEISSLDSKILMMKMLIKVMMNLRRYPILMIHRVRVKQLGL